MFHIPHRVDNQISFLFRFRIEFLTDLFKRFECVCRRIGPGLLNPLLTRLLAAALSIGALRRRIRRLPWHGEKNRR
jgi:hypothetical protein